MLDYEAELIKLDPNCAKSIDWEQAQWSYYNGRHSRHAARLAFNSNAYIDTTMDCLRMTTEERKVIALVPVEPIVAHEDI